MRRASQRGERLSRDVVDVPLVGRHLVDVRAQRHEAVVVGGGGAAPPRVVVVAAAAPRAEQRRVAEEAREPLSWNGKGNGNGKWEWEWEWNESRGAEEAEARESARTSGEGGPWRLALHCIAIALP